MAGIPKPPGFTPTTSTDSKKVVTRDETAFIIERYMLPQHREDPNVMRFVLAYLHCRNVKQAALEAGITKRDGENLKRRPDIHEVITQVTEKALLKYGYDAAEIVERVKEIVAVDPADLENPDGTFVESLAKIPPETRRAIKKFVAKNIYEQDPNGMKRVVGKLITVEFFDKIKGVELLGREKDIFKETKKVEHDLTKNMSSVLLDAKRRGEEAAGQVRDVGEQPAITVEAIVSVEEDDG